MKQLTFKLIIPLTVISFATFTKWWYVLIVDAPDTMFSGFPLPFVCEGWHTSMSLQFFMTEFVVDLLTYFLFWVAIIFCADRFLTTIKPHKIVTTVLWTLTGLIIFVMSFIIGNPDNVFYYKRDFDMQTLETGYKFVGQYIERPDLSKYNLEDKSK